MFFRKFAFAQKALLLLPETGCTEPDVVGIEVLDAPSDNSIAICTNMEVSLKVEVGPDISAY